MPDYDSEEDAKRRREKKQAKEEQKKKAALALRDLVCRCYPSLGDSPIHSPNPLGTLEEPQGTVPNQ